MAEAPRPAVAGISQPDAGTLSSKLELVGFVSSVHGSAALHHHTNPQLLLLLSRPLPSSAVAGTAVAGAPSLGCYLPELARRDSACMPYLAGKRKTRPFEPDRCRRLSRPEKPPEFESKSGQKVNDRPPPALTRATVPPQQISKNGNFPKWKPCKNPKI